MMVVVDVLKVGISKMFMMCNQLMCNQSILMYLVDGFFKKLIGGWKFILFSFEVCCIEFQFDFEFINKFIELVFGCIFKELVFNMVQVFMVCVKEVYCVG